MKLTVSLCRTNTMAPFHRACGTRARPHAAINSLVISGHTTTAMRPHMPLSASSAYQIKTPANLGGSQLQSGRSKSTAAALSTLQMPHPPASQLVMILGKQSPRHRPQSDGDKARPATTAGGNYRHRTWRIPYRELPRSVRRCPRKEESVTCTRRGRHAFRCARQGRHHRQERAVWTIRRGGRRMRMRRRSRQAGAVEVGELGANVAL